MSAPNTTWLVSDGLACDSFTKPPARHRMMLAKVFFVAALLLPLLACGRSPIDPPDQGPTVDATIYALGFCSLKCWRLEECGLADGATQDDCEDSCIDDALDALPGDPCWAEWIELRRCRVLEATCTGVEDEELPVDAQQACDERQQQLEACEP